MPYCPIQLLKFDNRLQDTLYKEVKKDDVCLVEIKETPSEYDRRLRREYFNETGILMIG